MQSFLSALKNFAKRQFFAGPEVRLAEKMDIAFISRKYLINKQRNETSD